MNYDMNMKKRGIKLLKVCYLTKDIAAMLVMRYLPVTVARGRSWSVSSRAAQAYTLFWLKNARLSSW